MKTDTKENFTVGKAIVLAEPSLRNKYLFEIISVNLHDKQVDCKVIGHVDSEAGTMDNIYTFNLHSVMLATKDQIFAFQEV